MGWDISELDLVGSIATRRRSIAIATAGLRSSSKHLRQPHHRKNWNSLRTFSEKARMGSSKPRRVVSIVNDREADGLRASNRILFNRERRNARGPS